MSECLQWLLLLCACCTVYGSGSHVHRHGHGRGWHASTTCHYNGTWPVQDTNKCIARVKIDAANAQLFWFGARWRAECEHQEDQQSVVGCYNPTALARYHSLGARLLRVNTFDMAYLRNLKIFPKMIFHSKPGSYLGCDHTFTSDRLRQINAQVGMSPVGAWHLRHEPMITWDGLIDESNVAFYTVAIIDVGFGQLSYLAYNFPAQTRVVRPYVGPLNFRHVSTPFVLVVFEQRPGRLEQLHWHASNNAEVFNLQAFMLKNKFTHSLVGLNWANVVTDGYAMDKQRILNRIDNCPSLIKQRLSSLTNHVDLPFVPESSLLGFDAWMSVTYNTPAHKFQLCCELHTHRSTSTLLDPVGDGSLPANDVRLAPEVTVVQLDNSMRGYQLSRRQHRDYIVLMDQVLYMLLLVDTHDTHGMANASHPFVLWLTFNVPGAVLGERFSAGVAGTQFYEYMLPATDFDRRSASRRLTLLLFAQKQHIGVFQPNIYSRTTGCPHHLAGRCMFDVRELMARHSLSLKSVSWLLVAPDDYLTYTQVQQQPGSERAVCSRLKRYYAPDCTPSIRYSAQSAAGAALTLRPPALALLLLLGSLLAR